MTIDEFNQLLPKEGDFLFIPHYMKDPKISKSVLAKIKADVFVGEAQFMYKVNPPKDAKIIEIV